MNDLDSRVRLAYEESVRGLDLQSETLNELHARTGIVIAASTVASAFLGAAALQRHASALTINLLGLIAFGVTISLCLAVLWPSEEWEFSFDASDLDDRYYAEGVDVTEMCREMLLSNARSRSRNNSRLRPRFRMFRLACGLLVSDILIWLVAVGVR